MRTFDELKQLLIQIKGNDYNVTDGTNVDGIIADMLKFIGHTDWELRDKLIYSTFNSWVDNGTLSTTQMKHILTTCLSEQYLFYGIGEKDTDSVFTRAFSSLAIALAFCLHDEKPFLTTDDVLSIQETVLRYVSQEKDYRGYVDGKGWAHAVAHIADVLVNISCCSVDNDYCIGYEGMSKILQTVKTLICNNEYVYTAEEDERLVTTFLIAADLHKFTAKELIGWIDSFNMTDTEYRKGTIPNDYYIYINRKNFMRSLYFKLQSQISTEGFDEICRHMCSFLIES